MSHKLQEAIDRMDALEEARADGEVLEEGSMRGTFADFLGQAEAAFLRVAAREIKRLAGGHAEHVSVKQGRAGGVVWLEYEGQDKGDIDLEFSAQIATKSARESKVIWFSKSAMRGRQEADKTYTNGTLSPSVVVEFWKAQFGR
jgi:hypothetical protein